MSARWFAHRVRDARGDQVLQIVRTLDNQMNNTSLILLLEAGTKKLLFPGDAQLENWQYALAQKKNRDLLADVDLYKVGRANYLGDYAKAMDWEGYTQRMIAKLQRLGKAHYIKRDLQKYLPAGYHNPLRVQQHHGARAAA